MMDYITTYGIEAFIDLCDDLMIVEEADVGLISFIRKDKVLNQKYNKAISNLLEDVSTNKDNCLKHAFGKHSSYDKAKSYFKDGKTVSYTDNEKTFIRFVSYAIKASSNDIKNKIFYGNNAIVITFNYGNSLGKIHISDDEDDIEVKGIKIVILNLGTDKKDVPKLKLKTAHLIE
jgi:hypothetical protein